MQVLFHDDQCQKRTRAEHALHVQSVMLVQQSVSNHGVKSACVLNNSRYFHVTENFCPDVMHDILEGVGKLECKLVIRHLIYEEKLFMLIWLCRCEE